MPPRSRLGHFTDDAVAEGSYEAAKHAMGDPKSIQSALQPVIVQWINAMLQS